MCSQITQSPIFEDLTNHFNDLYKTSENDLEKIEKLNSDVYIPVLDDPVTQDELKEAMGKMKNGGYDHKIEMFKIVVNLMFPMFLLLLNI